jgi:transposase
MMNGRQNKGLAIANSSEIIREGNIWLVPSQSSSKVYKTDLFLHTCTCADYQENGDTCKHLYAVQYLVREYGGAVLPKAEPKPTYKQEWSAYNRAQVNEKSRFLELLHELCEGVQEPVQTFGRPRMSYAEMLFAVVFKVYAGVSSRRFSSELRDALGKGFLTSAPHFNTVSKYLDDETLTPYLKEMITRSALPLKAVESDFAVDSSGFSTGRFVRWVDVKYGRQDDWHDWVKVHLMCGVKTNVVTSVEVSHRFANDSPFLKPLLETTLGGGFGVKELSADKGYDSHKNRMLVLVKGAQPYIPYREMREGETRKNKGATWERLYHLYKYNEAEFNAHYHKRSNVETTFHMIKAKFGERVRSKTATGQINEVLCKVLSHNLCCVIQSIYELGIEPTFWTESA